MEIHHSKRRGRGVVGTEGGQNGGQPAAVAGYRRV